MYYGKQKCKILKQIRAEIAKNNDIEYVVSECSHKGNCLGTCPKCESEVKYLENQLELRRKAGKVVLLAGIAAGLSLSVTGCVPRPYDVVGDMMPPEIQTHEPEEPIAGKIEFLDAPEDLVVDVTENKEEPLEGEIEYIPEDTEDVMGNMEYIPDETESSIGD